MASLLESQVKKLIAQGFKGKLLTGTVRRLIPSGSPDSVGDIPLVPSTLSVEGIVDNYNAMFRAQAGIPDTDVKILLIAGSLPEGFFPRKNDQVKFRDKWYQIRATPKVDPANASFELQGFEIEDPTV